MNLLDDPWLPVRRESGQQTLITPWQITDDIANDPIVALNTPRADFNGSLIQFLIGFTQTLYAPKDETKWGAWYETPPTPEQLRALAEPHRNAFNLDGDGPRFLQDFEPLDEKAKSISSLLIDAPGESTLQENRDLFTKRGQYAHLGLPAAIAALITLQTNAPSGGAGHRTSLRGGGPLTTLLIPDPLRDPLPANLWRLIWLNVFNEMAFADHSGWHHQQPAAIFPWLAPTRTSQAKGGVETTPVDAHPYQMYWGMPRRIRLELEGLTAGDCLLTRETAPLVDSYRTRNYGINYSGPWRHPLSPYSRTKDGDYLPRHAQPGGIGYRHWLELVLGQPEGGESALVITNSSQSYARRRRKTRLWAFGYDMDNMKARSWYESVMPISHLDDTLRESFVEVVQGMTVAASEIASNLRGALKRAWFKPKAKVRGDLSFIVDAFWHQTEADFYRQLEELHRLLSADQALQSLRESWFRTLCDSSLALFDQWATSGSLEDDEPKRIALARHDLQKFNYKKSILDALRLHKKKRAA